MSALSLDDDHVESGTPLSGTVVDGPEDAGKRIVVSLDADDDGQYDVGEPQVRISSIDSGGALAWSGLETDGLASGNYTVYAVEANNVNNRDTLTGATATVGVVDPPPTISNYRLTNPSGGDIQVQFDASEPLSTISVSITGAESATLSTADFAESGADPYTYTATYVAGSVGTYTATLDDAIDGGGNDGAGGESGSVNITQDVTPPYLQAAETADRDGDGTVDEVHVTFTEPIDDGTLSASDLTVTDGSATTVATGAAPNDDVVVLSVTGFPANDTSLTPQVILPPRRVTDLAGNDGPTRASVLSATDGAAPVIVAAATGNIDDDARIDRLNATLTEAVVGTSVRAEDYDVGGATYVGEAIVGYVEGERHLLLGFDEGPADDTGATPSLVYTRGSTVDAAGNPMADRTFAGTTDGVAPTLTLSVAKAVPDGFDVRAQSSEAATATYVVVEDGAPPPSTAQVLLGRDATDAEALRCGTLQVPAAGTNGSASVTGLSSGTSYDVYAVASDRAGNRREPPVTVDAATLAPPTDREDGGETAAGGGTTVCAATGRDDGVLVEIRNPGTRRPVSAPLGGVGSAGIVYRRITFEFDTRVNALSVRLVPGEREPADPALADVRVIEYFTVRRIDDGPPPFSTVSIAICACQAALPENSSLADVAFYRFVDGRWVLLDSTRVGERFVVTTGGFSSFAIAVPEPPPSATATATTTVTVDSQPGTTDVTPGTPTTTAPSTSTASPEEPLPTTQRAGEASVALVVAFALLFALLLVSRVLARY